MVDADTSNWHQIPMVACLSSAVNMGAGGRYGFFAILTLKMLKLLSSFVFNQRSFLGQKSSVENMVPSAMLKCNLIPTFIRLKTGSRAQWSKEELTRVDFFFKLDCATTS